jgi:hypothetical protein
MAARLKSFDATSITPLSEIKDARPELTTDLSGASYAPSPALALQDTLSRSLYAPTHSTPWSARQTMALVIGACTAFWAALGGAIYALMAIAG